MTVKRVHPLETLATSLAFMRAIVEVQLLVSLAVMRSCESLSTSRPFALVGFFFVVGTEMTLEVEVPSERATAAGHRTNKVCVVLPPDGTCLCRGSRGHILFADNDGGGI